MHALSVHRRVATALMVVFAGGFSPVHAQSADNDSNGTIAPPPSYIVPPASGQQGVYTTHAPTAAAPEPLPWQAAQPAPQPSPQPGTYHPLAGSPSPFAHAAPEVSQPLPKGPQMQEAVPVGNVDSMEVSEPDAPLEMPLEANPVAENPAIPTQETSPIFDRTADDNGPRKIVLRLLNKVTARAELVDARPGETVSFGRLSITAINCQTSIPTSQADSAALLEIVEHVPQQPAPKLLFRGWMYASSPSITALEHPIYDVTMVDCKRPEVKKEEPKKENPSKSSPSKSLKKK